MCIWMVWSTSTRMICFSLHERSFREKSSSFCVPQTKTDFTVGWNIPKTNWRKTFERLSRLLKNSATFPNRLQFCRNLVSIPSRISKKEALSALPGISSYSSTDSHGSQLHLSSLCQRVLRKNTCFFFLASLEVFEILPVRRPLSKKYRPSLPCTPPEVYHYF